jgi:hypothetical protein
LGVFALIDKKRDLVDKKQGKPKNGKNGDLAVTK